MTHSVIETGPTWSIAPPIETLADRTAGVPFGNMTAGGAAGLAGAFNGALGQIASAGSGVSGQPGWVGKRSSFGSPVAKAVIYGTTNVGYINTGAATSVTATIYGKNGTPSSGTDGTALGSITFNQNAVSDIAPRTITSTDQSTSYTHKWVYINGGANSTYIGQLVLYEMFSSIPSYLLYITMGILGDSNIANMAAHLSGLPVPFNTATLLGVSGNTAAQIAARVGSIPASSTDALIQGGTNDLVGLGTDAGIIPAYTSMLSTIPSNKKVVVIGIPRIDEAQLNISHPGPPPWLSAMFCNAKIDSVNADIATLAASYPNAIVASDVMAMDMTGKTSDGIHFLNAAVYAEWAGLLAKYL